MTRHQTYGLLFLVALIFAFLIDAPLIKSLQTEDNMLRNLGRLVSWVGDGSWMAVVLLIMALVAILLYRAFNVSRHRQSLTRSNVVADGKLCIAYIIAPFTASRSLMGDLWDAVLAVAYIGKTTQRILAAAWRSLADPLRQVRARVRS